MQLEICASSINSAFAAQKGGADRIELCSALEVGGITPSAGLLYRVLNQLEIETHVLIRPRGGDFCFSKQEIEVMIHDIHFAKKAGAHGVVFGALTAKNELDLEAIEKLATAAQGIDSSFHKAFDKLACPEKAFAALANLGVKRVLTSGSQRTALAGLNNLKNWQNSYGDLLEIMPGGGIRPENAAQFVGCNFKSIHSAAIAPNQKESSEDLIRELKQLTLG